MLAFAKYAAFIDTCSGKLKGVVDSETELLELAPKATWLDQGRNRHASFAGKIRRRKETAEIGGEIVWLKRLKTFRGHFWSKLEPKSDAEIFSEAKRLFHAGRYSEYLAISGYLKSCYSKNRVFQRMNAIAEKRA